MRRPDTVPPTSPQNVDLCDQPEDVKQDLYDPIASLRALIVTDDLEGSRERVGELAENMAAVDRNAPESLRPSTHEISVFFEHVVGRLDRVENDEDADRLARWASDQQIPLLDSLSALSDYLTKECAKIGSAP